MKPTSYLLQRSLNQFLAGSFKWRRQGCSPIRRLRLHSEKNNLRRSSIHQTQNTHQIRKSEEMDTLGDRQTGELVAFKPHQKFPVQLRCPRHRAPGGERCRGGCRGDRDRERPSFDDMDFRRQPAVFRQSAQRKHPNCVICTHQVAKTQQSNPAWQSSLIACFAPGGADPGLQLRLHR